MPITSFDCLHVQDRREYRSFQKEIADSQFSPVSVAIGLLYYNHAGSSCISFTYITFDVSGAEG